MKGKARYSMEQVDSEIRSFLEYGPESYDEYTVCEQGCNICDRIAAFQQAISLVQSGGKLLPKDIKKIKHPGLREALVQEICLRAARGRIE